MQKYLVRETNDNPDAYVLQVLQIIEILDSKYGKVVIANYFLSNYGDNIEPYFLRDLLEMGYKFSDDEKYKNWINK